MSCCESFGVANAFSPDTRVKGMTMKKTRKTKRKKRRRKRKRAKMLPWKKRMCPVSKPLVAWRMAHGARCTMHDAWRMAHLLTVVEMAAVPPKKKQKVDAADEKPVKNGNGVAKATAEDEEAEEEEEDAEGDEEEEPEEEEANGDAKAANGDASVKKAVKVDAAPAVEEADGEAVAAGGDEED